MSTNSCRVRGGAARQLFRALRSVRNSQTADQQLKTELQTG